MSGRLKLKHEVNDPANGRCSIDVCRSQDRNIAGGKSSHAPLGSRHVQTHTSRSGLGPGITDGIPSGRNAGVTLSELFVVEVDLQLRRKSVAGSGSACDVAFDIS